MAPCKYCLTAATPNKLKKSNLLYSYPASTLIGKSSVPYPSLNDLWMIFRDQTSLFTSKAAPLMKTGKHSQHKSFYTRLVKREIQRRCGAWAFWEKSRNDTSAAVSLLFEQDQRRFRRILRAERLSSEWNLANWAKMLPSQIFFVHVNRNKRKVTRIQCLLQWQTSSSRQDSDRADKGSFPTFHPRAEVHMAHLLITEPN